MMRSFYSISLQEDSENQPLGRCVAVAKESMSKNLSGVAKGFRDKVIKELLASLGDEIPLILCGPGHARDIMLSEIRTANSSRTLFSVGTAMSGRAGANEVLREGLAGELLEDYAISKEISLLEEA